MLDALLAVIDQDRGARLLALTALARLVDDPVNVTALCLQPECGVVETLVNLLSTLKGSEKACETVCYIFFLLCRNADNRDYLSEPSLQVVQNITRIAESGFGVSSLSLACSWAEKTLELLRIDGGYMYYLLDKKYERPNLVNYV